MSRVSAKFHEFMRQKVEVVRPERDIVVFGQTSLELAPSPTTFTCKFLAKLEVSNAFFHVYSTDIKCCMLLQPLPTLNDKMSFLPTDTGSSSATLCPPTVST